MGVEGAGLAYLVSSANTADMEHVNLPTVLSYIYDSAIEQADQHDINFQAILGSVQQHVAQLRSADDEKPSSSFEVAASNGRLGPATVAIDRSSVSGSFSYGSDNLTIESLGNFSSCRGNVAVYSGKWMYECTVLTPGIQQIGWATVHCPFTAEEGVGDAPDSYAIDGKRMRKWNVKPHPYGEPWVQGDVMGCCLDLDAGTLTFHRNGQSLGVAYDRVRTMQPSLAYFPAVSLSHTERCTLNFGAKPFVYPVQGYQPLQSPPATSVGQEAQYYCACLSRLCLIAAERQEGATAGQQGSTAAAAGLGAVCKLDNGDLVAGVTVPARAQSQSSVATRRLSPWAYSSSSSSSLRTAATVLVPPFAGSVCLQPADVVLLAAVVLEPLQQLFVSYPYLIHSALLPVLFEGQRETDPQGSGGHLVLMLQLLAVVCHEEFESIMFAVLEELAYRCQVSPLLVQDFPYTAGYPHLALAVSLLQHPPTMRLFVSHPDFTTVLEGLLTRKSPSPRDLQALLPHVWWRGCKDETASEERLRASVSIIITTLAKVEQRQYDLLELLLATPFHDPDRSTSSSGHPDDCALLVFLRFLLQKNRGALRDVPPPGLSESTVLMTTFFGLLRLLQPALQAACTLGRGPLAAFPAADILAATGSAAEASPVFDAPRLGGIVSHLAREHPLSNPEQQPVAVGGSRAVDEYTARDNRDCSNTQQHGSQQQEQKQQYVAPSALQDVWVPELLNMCMLLYCWRVGFNYKMIHTLSSSVASSSATLDELDRMIASSSEGDPARASTWLVGTRKVYHDELTRDVRLLTLLRVAFFSPSKQAALGNLTSYLAALVTTVADISAAQTSYPAAPAGNASQQPAPAAVELQQQESSQPASSNGSSSEESPLSNLLRYVPVVYVEVIIDYLTALRRCDEQSIVLGAGGPGGPELAAQASQGYVAWLCGSLNDPRIANPDVQESLLQVCGLLLEQPNWRSLVEAEPPQAQRLVQSLLQVFDSRLWHPASGVLLKLIKEYGFGHQPASSCPTGSLQRVLLNTIEGKSMAAAATDSAPAATVAAASSTSAVDPAAQLTAAAAAATARTKGFLNRLFNTLNWTLTEFTVCVGDLHNLRGRRSILEAQNQYRRTGLMFELSVNFIRILEFVVPTQAFLGSTVNRTRLRELLQFVLSHFTNGPDARHLNDLLQANQPAAGTSSSGGGAAAAAPSHPGLPGAAAGSAAPSPAPLAASIPAYAASAMQFESNSLTERVQKPALLAPVMGILLAVLQAHKAATETAAAGVADGGDAVGGLLLDELAEMADERFMSALQFMKDVDWCAFFPSCPLSGPLRAYAQLLDALAAARIAHESSAAARQLPEDVPDDFLDPITMDIMHDPVKLPDSQIVVDRTTIERHLLSSETDPFSRAPLTPQQLIPDVELKARLQHWMQQAQQHQQQH